jgi:hypothetical protein
MQLKIQPQSLKDYFRISNEQTQIVLFNYQHDYICLVFIEALEDSGESREFSHQKYLEAWVDVSGEESRSLVVIGR